MKKLIASDRVIKKNVGGNSTYARNLYANLPKFDWVIDIRSFSQNSRIISMVNEAMLGNSDLHGIIHYPADTGVIHSKRIPIITTVHGNASLHVPGIRSKLENRIWNERVKLACQASTGIVTVSENSKKDIVESLQIAPDSIRVIYHGINHEIFKPLAADSEIKTINYILKERFQIVGDFVLFLGNLEPRKNLKSLVAAVKSPNWPSHLKLVVVGRYAWGDKSILSEISNNSKIIYLGFIPIDDVVNLLRTTKCLVFPSLYEGWGFPVIEALAVGCSVISSTRGALIESTQGNALYLEDPESPEEIVGLVQKVLENPADMLKMKESGIIFAKEFTWEKSAKEHDAFFTTVSNSF